MNLQENSEQSVRKNNVIPIRVTYIGLQEKKGQNHMGFPRISELKYSLALIQVIFIE